MRLPVLTKEETKERKPILPSSRKPQVPVAVAFDAAGRKVFEASQPLGVATNNVAEYKALILGMKVAKVLGATKLQVFGIPNWSAAK
eukprot:jgi/Pico_ML_1/53994/g4443.t1